MAGNERADVAELVGDGLAWDVVVVQVAADAVEFIGDQIEGNIIWGVICKVEVVTSLVVQAKDLKGGSGESGVARGVGWERGLEVEMVAVGVRGTFCEPEWVLRRSGIETDAGQRAPELEAVLFLPSENSSVGHRGVEEGEDAHKIRVGRFVRGSRYLSAPRNVAKALVEDPRRCAEQVGAIVSPGETRHCL